MAASTKVKSAPEEKCFEVIHKFINDLKRGDEIKKFFETDSDINKWFNFPFDSFHRPQELSHHILLHFNELLVKFTKVADNIVRSSLGTKNKNDKITESAGKEKSEILIEFEIKEIAYGL
jgi:hypothetical protein